MTSRIGTRSVKLKTAFKREWFYYIDHKGMLFLEETEPKNYTSCLKDDRFLVSPFSDDNEEYSGLLFRKHQAK